MSRKQSRRIEPVRRQRIRPSGNGQTAEEDGSDIGGLTEEYISYAGYTDDAKGSSYDNPTSQTNYASWPGLADVYGAIENAHRDMIALNDPANLDSCGEHSALARHEARHCVAGEALGGLCDGVTIEGGGMSHARVGGEKNLFGEAQVWLAGGARNGCGAAGDFSPADWAAGARCARKAGRTPEEAIVAVQQLLAEPENAKAVDLMAAALDQKRTLSREDVLAIRSQAGMAANRRSARSAAAERLLVTNNTSDEGCSCDSSPGGCSCQNETAGPRSGNGAVLIAGALLVVLVFWFAWPYLSQGFGFFAMADKQGERVMQRSYLPSSKRRDGDRGSATRRSSIAEGRSDCYEVSPGQIHCPR